MPEKMDCTKRCVVVLPSLNPNENFDRSLLRTRTNTVLTAAMSSIRRTFKEQKRFRSALSFTMMSTKARDGRSRMDLLQC